MCLTGECGGRWGDRSAPWGCLTVFIVFEKSARNARGPRGSRKRPWVWLCPAFYREVSCVWGGPCWGWGCLLPTGPGSAALLMGCRVGSFTTKEVPAPPNHPVLLACSPRGLLGRLATRPCLASPSVNGGDRPSPHPGPRALSHERLRTLPCGPSRALVGSSGALVRGRQGQTHCSRPELRSQFGTGPAVAARGGASRPGTSACSPGVGNDGPSALPNSRVPVCVGSGVGQGQGSVCDPGQGSVMTRVRACVTRMGLCVIRVQHVARIKAQCVTRAHSRGESAVRAPSLGTCHLRI